MTKVALRGLRQRKLRAFVTMLAVLLGVAFIAGQLRPHRHDQPLLRRHLRRGLRGHRRRDLVEHHRPGRQRRRARRSPDRYLDACGRWTGCEKAAGGIFSTRPLRGREGRAAQRRFAPEFVSSVAPEPFETLTYTEGRPPRDRERGLDRRVHRRSRGPRDRGHAAHRRPGGREGATRSSASSGSATPRRAASGTAQLTLPEAQRLTEQAGRVRRHLGPGRAEGVRPEELRAPHRPRAAGPADRGDRHRGGRAPVAGHQGRPQLLPRRAARVRRASRCWWAAS